MALSKLNGCVIICLFVYFLVVANVQQSTGN